MPKVRQLTPELRREYKRREQAKRNFDIISCAAKISEYRSLRKVCEVMGESYGTVYSSLRNGSIRVIDMGRLIRMLHLDNDTVQALMGNPKKCRYEKGFQS